MVIHTVPHVRREATKMLSSVRKKKTGNKVTGECRSPERDM